VDNDGFGGGLHAERRRSKDGRSTPKRTTAAAVRGSPEEGRRWRKLWLASRLENGSVPTLASGILREKREERVRRTAARRAATWDGSQHGELLLGEGGGGIRTGDTVGRRLYTWHNGLWVTPPKPANESAAHGDIEADRRAPSGGCFSSF
jgi:hypothetical protein